MVNIYLLDYHRNVNKFTFNFKAVLITANASNVDPADLTLEHATGKIYCFV